VARAGALSAPAGLSARSAQRLSPAPGADPEGELAVEMPEVRQAAEPFASKLFQRGTKLLRTEPLRAMVIGTFVRGLSMRDVEPLCAQAGLGKLSKSTAAPDLQRVARALCGVPAPRPLRRPARG